MNCKTCKYFQSNPDSSKYGECRRYPQYMDILSDYWCGEHESPTNPTNYLTVEQYLGLSNETIMEFRHMYYALGGDDPIHPKSVRETLKRGFEQANADS